MRGLLLSALLIGWSGSAAAAHASELKGPARFCGYSPIIDLSQDESISVLQGGIHGGTFLWRGPFGELNVSGIGWASRPKGRSLATPTAKGHAIFGERRSDGQFVVAIWNRAQGVAYFSSPNKLTKLQLAAINRVDLFQEGEDPKGCSLRTMFDWGQL